VQLKRARPTLLAMADIGRRHVPTFDHLMAGTTAGGLSTVALFPLDLIKTRFQAETQRSRLPSITTAMREIVGREGWRALYAGMCPSLVGSTVAHGGFFFMYERAKAHMHGSSGIFGTGGAPLTSRHHLAASLQAGCIMVLLTNPLWLIKTRLQLQKYSPAGSLHANEYQGMIHGLRSIVREEGVCALYRGIVPALLLTSNGAVQFTIYEQLKVHDPVRHVLGLFPVDCQWLCPAPVVNLFNGGTAKILASCATYPYQVVKTRVQARQTLVQESGGEWRRSWRSVTSIWRGEGLRGFFKGVWPNALRVAPGAAVTFAVYEESLKLLIACRI